MPRRRFLLAALGAVSVTCATTSAGAATLPVQTLGSPGLLAMLGGERVVRRLGERYRQLVPAEDNAGVLVRAILTPSQGIVPPSVAAALAEQVTQDFTHGRTVIVDGWILAVTEARHCALHSLHAA